MIVFSRILLTLKITNEKRKKKVLKHIHNVRFIFFALLLFPGCGKIIDWGTQSVQQVTPLGTDRARAARYIRSIVTYDQITTKAYFDALWLSDEVREAYVDLFVTKFGKTPEQKNIFLRRQYEENNHFISFYV